MLQRNDRLRSLPILALVAGLLLLPVLTTTAQAAPLRESDPQLRAAGPNGGWAAWCRAMTGGGEKEGPSIDPNGGGAGKRARVSPPVAVSGWWWWQALVNVWGQNGFSIYSNGGRANPPATGVVGSSAAARTPGSSGTAVVQ